tara:strand:- start:196 stop:324 length:129 start_codon:yes stop_codon:yes gene_type:complete
VSYLETFVIKNVISMNYPPALTVTDNDGASITEPTKVDKGKT